MTMLMPWFFPVAISLGVVGTWTGLERRQLAARTRRDRGWWLMLVIVWLPTVYWALAQFLPQY
jgi:hypothetical protein